MKVKFALGWMAAALAASGAHAQLSVKTGFGGGDGWRAPNEILTGDTAGTSSLGNYNYLQAGNLERGLAYNPVTGNLILVSRSAAGNGIRILNGQTGVDVGSLAQGSGIISGGTFTTNAVAVANDGAIYVSNLTTNASVAASAFKVYQWTSEAASAPTTFSSSAIAGFTGTPRLGDSLDVTGSGAGTTLVAGGGLTTIGYAIINGSGATAVATPFNTPSGTLTAGDFRLGVTFGSTATDVWGKQTSQNMEVTTYAGATGTSVGSTALTSNGEAPMDFTSFGGTNYLATLDINNSTVRVYNVNNPLAPSLISSLTTTSGTLSGNGNATGSIKFGKDNGDGTIDLYAMSTNQGIQAFVFAVAVPEPSSLMLALLGAGGLLLRTRRRRTARA